MPEAGQDTVDLILQLLAKAGMIMEDASADAVLARVATKRLPKLIAELQSANTAAASLLTAASTLAEEL